MPRSLQHERGKPSSKLGFPADSLCPIMWTQEKRERLMRIKSALTLLGLLAVQLLLPLAMLCSEDCRHGASAQLPSSTDSHSCCPTKSRAVRLLKADGSCVCIQHVQQPAQTESKAEFLPPTAQASRDFSWAAPSLSGSSDPSVDFALLHGPPALFGDVFLRCAVLRI